jgi:hypothetical protein
LTATFGVALNRLLAAGMASDAKRLPVRLVPEEFHVPFVRFDMVNDARRFAAIKHAANRIDGQKFGARFIPFRRIATLARGRATPIAFALP